MCTEVMHCNCFLLLPCGPTDADCRCSSVFIGKQYKSLMNRRIWVYIFISWCSVDLETILQDNRRRTPMNADFIPDKLWSIAIYDDQDRFLPDILGFWPGWTTIDTDKHRRSRFSGTINYDKHRYIRMNQGKLGFWSTYQDFGADFES